MPAAETILPKANFAVYKNYEIAWLTFKPSDSMGFLLEFNPFHSKLVYTAVYQVHLPRLTTPSQIPPTAPDAVAPTQI
jgi:hypothetical protein